MDPPVGPGALEERYRQLLVELFERLQLKGISAGGKALSVPLDAIYVELKAVSDVPEAADSFSADERRLLQQAEGRGRHGGADVGMHLDSLRFERWRSEARAGRGRSERRSIEAWLTDPGSPALVILGDPGSGKSTLLHYLALRATREGLRAGADATPGTAMPLRSASGEPWLPVFVPLAAYDEWLRRSGEAVSLGDFLPIYYDTWHDLADLGPLFRAALDAGRALVLLDGLDEVLDVTTRQHVANQARALIQREGGRGNRFVVTSRVVGYREAPLQGELPHVTVLDFGQEEIATFASKWCLAVAEWAWGGLTEVAKREAATEEQGLLADVRANPSVLRLAANPLLLTMLSLLRRQGGKLPEQRVRLYERYVGMLLDNNWENVRSEGARSAEPLRFDQDLATDYLIELALWLQRHKPSGTARRQEVEGALVEIALGLDGMDPRLAQATAREEAVRRASEFLQDMRHFAGLLAERGRDAYGFSHLTFQEYFAGRALARMEPQDRWTMMEPNLHRPRWREPILLCAGQLGIVERRGKAVSDLARRVLGAGSAHEVLLHRDVFLVAAVAADNVGLDKALLDELIGRLMELAGDRVPAVRRGALEGMAQLARQGIDGAIGFFEERIRTKERAHETASALAGVLGAEPCVGLSRGLCAWLEDSDYNIRVAAMRPLGSMVMYDEEVRRALMVKLEDPNPYVVSVALGALTPMLPFDAELRRLIFASLDAQALNVRRAATIAMGTIAKSDEDARQLIIAKLNDPLEDENVCGAAIAALRPLVSHDFPAITELVLHKIDDPRLVVRYMAIEVLGTLVPKDDKIRQHILDKLDDPDDLVRAHAIRALEPLVATDSHVRRLVLARRDDPEDVLRATALDVVGRLVSVDEEVRRSVLLTLERGSWFERPAAAAILLKDPDTDTCRSALKVLVDTLDTEEGPQPLGFFLVRAQAAAALGGLEPEHRDEAIVTRVIRLLVEETDEDVLDAAYDALLRLVEAPDPVLQAPAATSAATNPLDPIFVKNLTLHDFKNFPDRTLDLTHTSALEGHWTCIAGINGAGKSAILQALSLVLLGEDLAADLGSALLQRMPRRDGERTGEARIDVTLRQGDRTHKLALVLGKSGIDREAIPPPEREAMRAFWSERARHHLFAGYGAGRNLSERTTEDDSKHPDVRRQMTLFDPLSPLPSTGALLASKNEHGPVLTLLRRLLATVLEGTGLSVAPDANALRFVAGTTTISPAELPDGFRTTVAWLGDLCTAWYEKAPEEALTGEPERMRGIVLVDEIDAHLHAKLQRLLVPRLRRALPKVQWIVTTHSPLILSSFDRREIVALGRTKPIDRQILGFTTDEVYEWLMDVEPRSAALDSRFANGNHAVGADVALILAQSPEVSEEDAEENRAWRQKLAAKLKEGSGRP